MTENEIKLIRQIRHDISREQEHEVDKVIAYYRTAQEELRKTGEFRFEEEATESESAETEPNGKSRTSA